MNADGANGANIAYFAVLLLLPLAALIARRLPLGSVVKMALAWVAIFGVLILIVGNWARFAPSLRAFGDVLGVTDQSVSGGAVRIRMSGDGHFWAAVNIDGVQRRMLIDSGATTTAISSGTALAAKLDLAESDFPTVLETANGTVSASRSTARRIQIGSIRAENLPVMVSPAFGDTDVIGMNFLSRLKSWRVENGFLVLEPNQADPG